MAKKERKPKRIDHPEKGNYLSTPFVVTHSILLGSCIAALGLLLLTLIIILSSPYEKFYFEGKPIVYLFFVLVVAFIVILASLAMVHVLTRDQMPTYDEFKRAQNRFAYLKKKSRFPELMDIDKECKAFQKAEVDPNMTLESLCRDFRNYNANKLKLFYSEEDIRKFIANLSVSKIMILQGMSGTGKTSIAVAFGKFINNSSTVVPVQPMWKEKSDLLGYYNEFTGKFNETTILKKLYESNYSDKIFIIVLDEMNIARVEYYFSEFLSLLELPPNSERQLAIASNQSEGDPELMSHGRIILPNNVWFLGTANNDDSTFAISDKVYDRAMVMNLNNRADRFKAQGDTPNGKISASSFTKMIEEARKTHSLSEEGKKRLKDLDEYLISTFHITFGNRIMMQIRNYVPVFIACGGNENEALDDIISKKLLRKLEAQNPIFVKNKSLELIAKFDELFGQDVMKDSIAYINSLANNI
ncbi:MAG: AAA family ATPase [Bacilli bacterium]|nr:AAA family ATPase [Bacilli bacterium]